MRKNLYDMFSEYQGELPEIKEEACDSERIRQLVHKKNEKKNIKVRRNPKIFVLGIAAAVAAATSITAAAYTDGFGRFKTVLTSTKASPAVTDELPLVNGSDVIGMENNISVDTVAFTGSESAEVKTVGMYYDNNTLMLSVEMKFEPGTVIPDNAVVIPYFTKKNGTSETELTNQSGVANAAPLNKDDEDGTYFATFYLTESGLAGSRIGVSLKNVLRSDDLAGLQKALIAEQESWRDEYGYNGDTAAWKAYWKENDLDKATEDFIADYLENCAKAVEGNWNAEIEIPADIAKEKTFSGNGFSVKADTLSLVFDAERQLPEGGFAIPVITLKDGTVIYDAGTTEERWFRENGVLTNDKSERFAQGFSNIHIYKAPHSADDIAQIEAYVFSLDGSGYNAEGYTVYKAE